MMIVFAKRTSFARGGLGEDIFVPHKSLPPGLPPQGGGVVRPSLEGRSQPGLCSQTSCSPGRLFPPRVRESVMFLACPPGGQW